MNLVITVPLTFAILIVDDDQTFCKALQNSLNSFGRVEAHYSCKSAMDLIHEASAINLLLIDYFLPDGNGLSVIQEFKKSNQKVKSILFSGGITKETAMACVNMQISALLEKPFQSSELKEIIDRLFNQDTIQLNIKNHQVTIGELQISLTAIEFKIFKHLFENTEMRLSRNCIIQHVWGETQISENAFDTHLGNIKKKMGPHSECLTNIKGVGYALEYGPSISGSTN